MTFSKRHHQMMKFINKEHGFTLIEMMVYVALAGMLLATAVTAFLAQNKSYNRQDVITEIQQNIRGAFEPMVADVRFAGMGLLESSDDAFVEAEETTFTVNYEMDDTLETVTYSLNGNILERNGETLSENIEHMRFEYLYDLGATWDWANNSAKIETETGLSSKKALEQIRAVKIIMLGSARPASFNPSDPGTYMLPLGQTDYAGLKEWPVIPNTGYKRMMSVIAQCRNNHE